MEMNIEIPKKIYHSKIGYFVTHQTDLYNIPYILESEHNRIVEEFYIWLQENRWFTFSNGKWNYTFEHGTSISKETYENKYRKTTQELLEIFNNKIK